jgi:predicted neutral ceramidase superfamily lipid hydrolase
VEEVEEVEEVVEEVVVATPEEEEEEHCSQSSNQKRNPLQNFALAFCHNLWVIERREPLESLDGYNPES